MLGVRRYSTFSSAKSMAASMARLFDRRPELSPEETSQILVESMEGTFENYMKNRPKHLRLDNSYGEAPIGLKHPAEVSKMTSNQVVHLLKTATSETQVFVTLEELPKPTLKVLNAALSNPVVHRIEPIAALVKNHHSSRHNVVGVGFEIMSWKWLVDHGKHEQAQSLVESRALLHWVPCIMQIPKFYPAVTTLMSRCVLATLPEQDVCNIVEDALTTPMAENSERSMQLVVTLWSQALKDSNAVADKIACLVLKHEPATRRLPRSALTMFFQIQKELNFQHSASALKIFVGETNKRQFSLERFFEYAIRMRDANPEKAAVINDILKKQLVDPNPDLVFGKMSLNNILQSFRSKGQREKTRYSSRSILNHI